MTTVRVVTWNVWHRFGPWGARQDAIIATLSAASPDVVCLQECYVHEDGDDQPRRMAAALDLPAVADASRVEQDGVTFGNAILSRWPLDDRIVRPLPADDDHEEWRTVLGVRTGGLHVVTTHLNFQLHHSAVRQRQAAAVARLVARWAAGRALPAIVTGDLNADPTSAEIGLLTGRAASPVEGLAFLDAWEVAGVGPGHTWDRANRYAAASHEASRRIDYVLVERPWEQGRGRVVAARLIGVDPVADVQPSDHYGVAVDIAVDAIAA